MIAQLDLPPGDWPFGDLRTAHYGLVLADPPWRFSNFSAKGEAKNPVAHYGCMTLASIKALPVGLLAAPDCALVMWATAPLLPAALAVIDAWGFTFKSAGAWAKQSSTGKAWAFGTGYCFRSAAEFFLLATRGAPKVLNRSTRNLIVEPVREHSRKPEQMHDMAAALYPGPRCELFARQRRPGWDAWGNQMDKFDG